MARDPLVVEHTPNPNTLKVLLPGAPVETPGADFTDPDSARAGSPIAARLLAFEGIERVYLGADFVAVTKLETAAWRELAPRLLESLQDHLASGAAWTRPGLVLAEVASAAGNDAETIRRILEEEIRPAVARDGGDVRFISYRDQVLELEMHGACAGCPSSGETLRLGIEARLKQAVPELREIVARDA